VHLGESSFPVGKVEMMTLFPMNFIEFLQALNDSRAIDALNNLVSEQFGSDLIHEHLWSRLKQYLIIGGLPETVRTFRNLEEDLFFAFSEVRRIQNTLVNAYLADMAKHAGKVNAMHLNRVWKGVVTQLVQAQDISISRFKFKGVVPGISHYSRLTGAIDWLCACGLVHKVPIVHAGYLPLSAFTKENQFKLLLFDVGILGALAGLAPKVILDYEYGTYKEYIAENFVAQELLCSSFQEFYSWQENQAEVDFLCEIDGQIMPIEVKSGKQTRTKSLFQFCKKYQITQSVILSGNSLKKNEKKGVYKLPLYLAGRLIETLSHSNYSGA